MGEGIDKAFGRWRCRATLRTKPLGFRHHIVKCRKQRTAERDDRNHWKGVYRCQVPRSLSRVLDGDDGEPDHAEQDRQPIEKRYHADEVGAV